jgi:hypothetical protein
LYQISLHAVLKLRERVHCGSVLSPMVGLSRSCVAPTFCCSVGESVASVLSGTNGSLKKMCRSFWHQQVAECGRDGWVGPFGTNGSLQFDLLLWTDGLLGCWIVTSTICRTIKVKFEYLVGSGTFDFTRVFRRF